MEENFCQSCGMPLERWDDGGGGNTNKMYGTEENGTKSKDYCVYCYENGKFTFSGSMKEMIEVCVPHMTSANNAMTQDQARSMMLEWFPTLKRWNK